jgi:replicative DNA helicase
MDLNQCDESCLGCIKKYVCKHKLVTGQKFKIKCKGIPKFEQLNLFDKEGEGNKTATYILDPVQWAAKTLDWHCLDPDGEVWERRDPEEFAEWKFENPDTPLLGHSRYHRPYQADMLRCSARRKVFRIGRQAGKTEAIVVSMLYHLFTKPGISGDDGFKIVVITPYQAQIDLIFKRMLQLIRSNANTQNSLRRHVKAPIYTIELHNNSTVMGFTAGTKSGGNAEAVRGQHAHMLVFDEADYLAAKDMDAAWSITTNFPQASVWMSSTPSGKREKFFSTCHSKLWKEFYYPSTVNPMWSENLEALLREDMTDIAYKHEVFAEFGEQEEGVFQNVHVQAAILDYKYEDMQRFNTWTYTMGVDWNDTAIGTTIVVLGFDPARKKFIVVDRQIVQREGHTQLAACQRVAELNRAWMPMAIYIDAGHGGTQWEVLRKFGYDSTLDSSKGPSHPDARLKDIVKRYQFGGTVETRDLFTNQIIKKPGKAFLVENTVRRFESGDIKFSKYDDILERQLQGYIIKRKTVAGIPVYAPVENAVGDHTLDALMLSVMAFTMEVSPFGKPKYQTGIAFSGGFGERIEPPIYEGDLVIKNEYRQKVERSSGGARPNMERADDLQQSSLIAVQNRMPGNHLQREKQLEFWEYPGFMRDAPRPRSVGLAEREKTARTKLGLVKRRASRPRRKHI